MAGQEMVCRRSRPVTRWGTWWCGGGQLRRRQQPTFVIMPSPENTPAPFCKGRMTTEPDRCRRSANRRCPSQHRMNRAVEAMRRGTVVAPGSVRLIDNGAAEVVARTAPHANHVADREVVAANATSDSAPESSRWLTRLQAWQRVCARRANGRGYR